MKKKKCSALLAWTLVLSLASSSLAPVPSYAAGQQEILPDKQLFSASLYNISETQANENSSEPVTGTLNADFNLSDTTALISRDTKELIPSPNIVSTSGLKTNNLSANDYLRYGILVSSYMMEQADDTLLRIEAMKNGSILLETYSKTFHLLSTRTLGYELALFGGFYEGADYCYFVFGQSNPSESDAQEVLRVVKYTKSFERIGHVSILGANTHTPFHAGSLRMEEADGRLYIHTCHSMYTASDSLNHQANMTFVIDEEAMEVVDSFYNVMNIAQAGYVSHSFNQFIRSDGTFVYRVDHGDAHPRAVTLTRCRVGGHITTVSYTLPFSILGRIGDNNTGVSIGGFELSSGNCLILGNSVDQSNTDTYQSDGPRNIFLSITDKNLEHKGTIWLTDYTASDNITVRTPQMVKLNDDRFLLLWEEYHTTTKTTVTRMTTVNADGTQTAPITDTPLALSDCTPIVTSDGLVNWYVTDGNAAYFCSINPYHLSEIDLTTGIYGSNAPEGPVTDNPGVNNPDRDNPGGSSPVDDSAGSGSVTPPGSSTVTLKKPILISARKSGKNKIKIKWKKTAKAKGYQIYYSRYKNKGYKLAKTVGKNKNTYTIKKLKTGRKYYIRIRAYTIVNGKRITSKYSVRKVVKL